MYRHECDWCGKRIDVHGEPYVKASIEIVNTSKDWKGTREKRIEPTRFFHVTPLRSREEWNRLGIEVKDESVGDCCYTRALKSIEGEPEGGTPDMGLEWRLVPVGARVSEGRRASREPGKPVQLSDGVLEFLNTLAPAPRTALNRALRNSHLTTLDEIEEMGDSELMGIKGIGQTTVTKLRQYIAADEGKPSKQQGKVGA